MRALGMIGRAFALLHDRIKGSQRGLQTDHALHAGQGRLLAGQLQRRLAAEGG